MSSSLAVCICTFKRHDGLVRLLEGLDNQVFSIAPAPSLCVIVVDNSIEGDAAEICAAYEGAWPLHYRHEPRPGISYARNTALAAVPRGTDYVAMIDDDEVPACDWLEQLLGVQARSNADIVVGPTTPVFPDGTAAWIDATGFFLKPQNQNTLRELDPDPPAATCNVLLRANLFERGANSFDPDLALSGGEDKLLFQDMKLRGHRFAWATKAHVHEYIPSSRANLAYMLREAYRRGGVKFPIKRRLKSRSPLRSLWIGVRLFFRSLLRAAGNLLLLLAALGRGRQKWVPHALNLADNVGTVAGVLQIPNRHYRTNSRQC